MDVMESDLTCCVCLEIFVYPLMLPCTHNLCRRCVQGLTSDTSITKFNCPKCRSEIQVDARKGINSLPRNLALDNLACLFRNKARISAERNCNVHNQSLDFYCQTCKCLVCGDCSTSKHNDFPHNVSSMKHLIAEEKNNVQDLIDQMDDIEAELNKNKRTVQRYIKDIKANEETGCHTIEQNLAQLIGAINTMKEAFVKKVRQDSQQQIEHLASLEQDYRRLQLDICALRSQIRYQDSPDLIQQYTAYQNIKMRVSSFLAFKLFKLTCPPQSQPDEITWKLDNAQHVYQAIQALQIHKESTVQRVAGTSQSLPASPKYVAKPLMHEQNSLEYSSDNEGHEQAKGDSVEKRHFRTKSLAPRLNILTSDRQMTQPDVGGLSTPRFRSPISAPVQSGGESSVFRFSTKTVLQNKPKHDYFKPEHNFNTFMGAFRINPGNFVASQNKEGKKIKVKAGPGDMDTEEFPSEEQSSTSLFGENSSLVLPAFGGARPKEPRNVVSNGHTSRLSQTEASHPRCSLAPETENNMDGDLDPLKLDSWKSPDYQRSTSLDSASSRSNTANDGSTDVFGDQTFLFTVGSSAKTRKGRSKGQTKRDHSGGRSHPNKHHK